MMKGRFRKKVKFCTFLFLHIKGFSMPVQNPIYPLGSNFPLLFLCSVLFRPHWPTVKYFVVIVSLLSVYVVVVKPDIIDTLDEFLKGFKGLTTTISTESRCILLKCFRHPLQKILKRRHRNKHANENNNNLHT